MVSDNCMSLGPALLTSSGVLIINIVCEAAFLLLQNADEINCVSVSAAYHCLHEIAHVITVNKVVFCQTIAEVLRILSAGLHLNTNKKLASINYHRACSPNISILKIHFRPAVKSNLGIGILHDTTREINF
jgi:hypothetical protein